MTNMTNEQLIGALIDAKHLNDEDDDQFDRLRAELLRRLGAAVSAPPQPDRKMLEAVAEDGLLVTWDKDHKFNFSQVVRLMAEFAIEHPWAESRSLACPKCSAATLDIRSSAIHACYVECSNCGFDAEIEKMADMLQFFAAAPAQEPQTK